MSGPGTAGEPPEDTPSGLPRDSDARFALGDAIAVTIARNGAHQPVAVWVTTEEVRAAELDLEEVEVEKATRMSGEMQPFPHPIERPAASVGADGTVTIGFVGLAEGGESVYLTRWDRRAATSPENISGPPRPETVLVHATTDPAGEPVLAWLESSTLSIGVSAEGTIIEEENVDELTCDCCNPAPVALENELFVAYRDFDRVDGEVVRDVVALSRDGSGWTGPTAIADDHWFIDACPFSGPSAIVADDALVVAWMDGRQTVHPDQANSTVWVDRSEDGGHTFGADLAVTSGGLHRWPVMARDEAGAIHLVWETQGPEGGLSYSRSEDGGRSFTEPVLIVERDPEAGSPTSPSVIVHDDRLLVSWADGSGGHIAVWSIGENGSR